MFCRFQIHVYIFDVILSLSDVCFIIVSTSILPQKILKRDPLEIQHPKFGNSWLDLIETVHEMMSDRLTPGWVQHCSKIKILNRIIYLLENTFFLPVWYRQDLLAHIRTTYLESRITLKIAKTHISHRAKNPRRNLITQHVTNISSRVKKPSHFTFLLDQTQIIPYRYVVRIFVCLSELQQLANFSHDLYALTCERTAVINNNYCL